MIDESSLREIDNIRQQIYHLKGGDKVKLKSVSTLLIVEDLSSQTMSLQNVPMVVVGTKMDLVSIFEFIQGNVCIID